MPIRIYINPRLACSKILRYVFLVVAENKKFECQFTGDPANADLRIAGGEGDDFPIAENFYEKILRGETGYQHHFQNECVIIDETGRRDLLSTIFYCINSIQEYNDVSDDVLGRFEFKRSYQDRFGLAGENIVQRLIDEVCRHPRLTAYSNHRRRSKIFLSHDIDSIHGAWKEDGFHALKTFQLGKLFSVMLNEALGKPDWLNMDKIMDIEDDYGFRSVFYWLLYKDKGNSDYTFKSATIQRSVQHVSERGWEHGLHKSLGTRKFQEEIRRMGMPIVGNRYHYLNFRVPGGYAEIENAKLKLDTSLGYYEQWGFRNSYGLPFMPYDLSGDRVYDFVEVPMQVMDRTFFSRKMSVAETLAELTAWFEKNKNDCVFAINFHNNFFSGLKYNGYIELYKSLLGYFRDSGFEPATQSGLVNEFYRPEKFIFN